MRLHLLVLLSLTAFPLCAGTSLPDGPHIAISGSATVSETPNRVRVGMEFQHLAATPLAAKQAVDAAVSRYLQVLEQFGIDDDAISAPQVSVSESVDYDKDDRRIPWGFTAEREVTVVLGEVGRLNDLLDAGLKAGALGIGQVRFELAEASIARARAKQQAVEDALRKAAETAASFGMRLGQVYSIDSVNSRRADAYAGATHLDRVQVSGSRIQPGRYLQPKVEISESVSAVFHLQR